jgi:hypothetical protein
MNFIHRGSDFRLRSWRKWCRPTPEIWVHYSDTWEKVEDFTVSGGGQNVAEPIAPTGIRDVNLGRGWS